MFIKTLIMTQLSFRELFFFSSAVLLFLNSCDKPFKDNDYTAYFGGEVSNPKTSYVLLYKDSTLIDTIPLDKNNRFYKKFDSLTPGLYTFKHDPEYQYVYFDKNDSLMVRVNANDFDNSVVFCGRGEEKNNFLMELYLKNEKDRSGMYEIFDYDLNKFEKNIDSSYTSAKQFAATHKQEQQWSDDFDAYVQASVDFPYYAKKEIYPQAHKIRTGKNILNELPKDFYGFRKKIHFNDDQITNYSPFVRYLTVMLNNIAASETVSGQNSSDAALELNIRKLNIADSLFTSQKIKNSVLNNIAFMYLLEDQHIQNNKKFLDRFYTLSTDNKEEKQIRKIGDAVQLLKAGNRLPDIMLFNDKDEKVAANSLFKKKTVVFFWTEKAKSHIISAHKIAKNLAKKYPNVAFIAINLDEDQQEWKTELANYNFEQVQEYRVADFEALKAKWVITKIHRTLIINADGTIANAFTNLFDVKFEDNLK